MTRHGFYKAETLRGFTCLLAALFVLLDRSLAESDSASDLYVVHLRSAAPIATYDGGIAGFPATATHTVAEAAETATNQAASQLSGNGEGIGNGIGRIGDRIRDRIGDGLRGGGGRRRGGGGLFRRRRPRINLRAPHVLAFARMLTLMQDRVAHAVGVAEDKILYRYQHVSNGFAAVLTPKQVQQLLRNPDVASVSPSVRVQPLTTDSPAFMQLPQSMWATAGGQTEAGEGVVVGIVDTGIWPEHPSFANNPADPLPARPSDWQGKCESSSSFPASACNGKLIGARSFSAGARQSPGFDRSKEYMSPRDKDGHGTWCAGAAAGTPVNAGKHGVASGMAPRAFLASYKALWETGGSSLDVEAAINSAVADGVDVLSLSLGGAWTGSTYFHDTAELNAHAAGVVVVYAAGNSGTPKGSDLSYRRVLNFAPWYLSVGASSISRFSPMTGGAIPAKQSGPAAAKLSTPALTLGSMDTNSTDDDAGSDGASAPDPAPAAGVAAGAASDGENSTAATPPSNSHVTIVDPPPADNSSDSTASRTANERVASSKKPADTRQSPSEAPVVAGFSSRGPVMDPRYNPTEGYPTNDILKPDVIAPGVDVMAAASGGKAGEVRLSSLSGTSMATPHVAGIAALLVQQYPDWTPAQVMSAMQTTARVTNNKGRPIRTEEGRDATAWHMGSGHVDPTRLLDPGLTFDAQFSDYLKFLAGLDMTEAKRQFGRVRGVSLQPIRAYNLNRPAVTVSRMKGKVTVTRRVTNVANETSTYSVKVNAPLAAKVKVSPTKFTIAPGETVAFTVALTKASGAKKFAFSYGSLTWADEAGHVVRCPLLVQPI